MDLRGDPVAEQFHASPHGGVRQVAEFHRLLNRMARPIPGAYLRFIAGAVLISA